MRNSLYKGSTPEQELEFAKTAVALGQPVDVGALIDALEKSFTNRQIEIDSMQDEIEDLKREIYDLQLESENENE